MTRRLFQPNWAKVIPYVIMHLAALISVLLVPFRWSLVELCVGLYFFRMFWLSAGNHRYFSHRAFNTSRIFQFVIGLMGNLSLMRGPISWASHHRYHHYHSDAPKDFHSPLQHGFLWSHTLWFLSRDYEETRLAEVRDLNRYPELVWLNKYYFLPAYVSAALLWIYGGFPAFAWGFLLSTVLTWHCAFLFNSMAHSFGKRAYGTQDTSRNSLFLAFLILGEGWHNNHHHHMNAARVGWEWWQVDPTYYVLWLMSKTGLIWDLKGAPPREILEKSRVRDALPAVVK
jgi:stearoyl-CoA desaturase (delta-9 desaturase)